MIVSPAGRTTGASKSERPSLSPSADAAWTPRARCSGRPRSIDPLKKAMEASALLHAAKESRQ